MAVFVSASDETLGGGIFHHAGWLARESDWYEVFAPAWQKMVLDGPPAIPFLHMVDIRSRKWRLGVGLSDDDAENRVDAAFRVIADTKGLYPLSSQTSADSFARLFRSHKIVTEKRGQKQYKQYEPDHLCFLGYVYLVLNYVYVRHPDTERVDFVIERKHCVFDQINDFYAGLPDELTLLGAPELTPLMGELILGGKERAPLQAADVLCWHAQRAEAGRLTGVDAARFESIAQRPGIIQRWTDSQLEEMEKNQREQSQLEQFDATMNAILRADPKAVRAEMAREKQQNAEKRKAKMNPSASGRAASSRGD